ncbi:MAG: hypothetical protein ACRCZO_16230 [Cetobacterium sp.]
MTNSEYEAASITAAGYADKFEGEHKLKQCDKAIAVLEASLARLQAERREIVNRYDLNKCKHRPEWDIDGDCFCLECGERLV